MFDVSKSNDPLECTFHIKALQETYKNLYFKEEISKVQYEKFHRAFLDVIDGMNVFGRSQNIVLTASFCDDSHELSKWRAYGDNGAGVAIGVNKEKLVAIAEKEGMKFGKIEYLSSAEMEEKAKRFWLDNKDSSKEELEKHIEEFYKEGYFIKDAANADENEFRLIAEINGGDYILPGIAHKVDDSIDAVVVGKQLKIIKNISVSKTRFIECIILGPNCDASISEINILCNKRGIFFNSVNRSPISMR